MDTGSINLIKLYSVNNNNNNNNDNVELSEKGDNNCWCFLTPKEMVVFVLQLQENRNGEQNWIELSG